MECENQDIQPLINPKGFGRFSSTKRYPPPASGYTVESSAYVIPVSIVIM